VTTVSVEKFQSPWYRERGVIYFLAVGRPAVAVKIGVSKAAGVLSRMRKTQTHNHGLVELLGVIPFDQGEKPLRQAEIAERELHRRFAEVQIFQDGLVGHEWFAASPELLAYISSHSTAPEVLGLPRTVARPRVAEPACCTGRASRTGEQESR
jgi:hypothetical protein